MDKLRRSVFAQLDNKGLEARTWQLLIFPGQLAKMRLEDDIVRPSFSSVPVGPHEQPQATCHTGWRRTLDHIGALGHFTCIDNGRVLAYDVRLVLVDAMGVEGNVTGARCRQLLRPKHPPGWRARVDRLMCGGVVPELAADKKLLDSIAKRRAESRERARDEVRELFADISSALQERTPLKRIARIEAAFARDRAATQFPQGHSLSNSVRRLCPEYQPPVPAQARRDDRRPKGTPRRPGFDADDMLTSILAVLMLERAYEVKSSSELPLELVLADGVPCTHWQGWDGHPRTVRNRLKDLSNRELRRELSLDRDYKPKEEGSNTRSGARRSFQFADLGHEPCQIDPEYGLVESSLIVDRILASMTPAQAKIARLCIRAQELGVPEEQLFQQAGLPPSTARKTKQRLKPLLRDFLAA
ncbi:MAG: hypothetical protein WEB52_14085 [Dehalococcoidia bacterium]